jgi:hypothetical protein
MMRSAIAALCGVIAFALAGPVLADAKFEHLSVRIEQNVTDNDFEVVIEATAGETGFATLTVTAPDGRVVADFQSPKTKLGMRAFRFETPEPKALARIQADYPAGDYTFTASTVAGLKFSEKATLSHKLPTAVTFVRPQPKEQNVPASGWRIEWRVAKDIKSCLLTLENDTTGVKVVQATLAGTTTSFNVPEGVLEAGAKYKVSIGSVAKDGNAAYVETAFTVKK